MKIQELSATKNMIKNIILYLLLIMVFSCSTIKNKKAISTEPKNYINLNYEKFNYQGKEITSVGVKLKDNKDSISKFISKHERRFHYLLTNRINIDTLNKLYPDTLKINKIFKSEITKNSFIKHFNNLCYPNKELKEKFSIEEVMSIASKFFLVEKTQKKTLGVRICVGINGLKENNTDYTELEALCFEAIFDKIFEKEGKPLFFKNFDNYFDSLLKNYTINEVKNARYFMFKSMENDTELKKYLMNYFTQNEDNIPFIIK